MGKTSNAVKQRWNKEHYVQVKVSVHPEIAEAFKEKCKAKDVSIASEITRFMREQCGKPHVLKTALKVSTRQQRRKAITVLNEQLGAIIDAESLYIKNIPENLRNSVRYETATQSVQALQDAINSLNAAYK